MALPISTPTRNPALNRCDEAYKHYLETSSAKTIARCCGLLSFFGKKDTPLRRQTRYVVTCVLKSKRTWRGYRSLKRYSFMTYKQRYTFVQGLSFNLALDNKDAVVTDTSPRVAGTSDPNRGRPTDLGGESNNLSSGTEEFPSTAFHRGLRSNKMEISRLRATVALREQELEEASAISEDYYNLLSLHDQLKADHELLIKEKEKLQFRLKKLHDKSLEQGVKNTSITKERDELVSKVKGMASTIRRLQTKPTCSSVNTQTDPIAVRVAQPVSTAIQNPALQDSINYRNLNARVITLVPQLTNVLLELERYIGSLFGGKILRILHWKTLIRHVLSMSVSLHNQIGRAKMVEILGQPLYDRLKSIVDENSRTVGGLDALNYGAS